MIEETAQPARVLLITQYQRYRGKIQVQQDEKHVGKCFEPVLKQVTTIGKSKLVTSTKMISESSTNSGQKTTIYILLEIPVVVLDAALNCIEACLPGSLRRCPMDNANLLVKLFVCSGPFYAGQPFVGPTRAGNLKSQHASRIAGWICLLLD